MTLVIGWMAGALLSFVVSAVAVRELSSIANIFEIGILRTGGGLVILVAALLLNPSLRARIIPAQARAHVPRNLAHALGGMFWTLAIGVLPFATVFALEFTAPAWAALLALLILGEQVSWRGMMGIGINLIGVLIILRPSLSGFAILETLPLLAAFCFALSVVLTRRLAVTGGVFPILFWMMVLQLPIYLVGWLMFPMPPAGRGITLGLAPFAAGILAIAGLCSQLCLSKALRLTQTVQVVTLDFLRVPLIGLIGWSFYSEPADMWVFVGSLVIMAGIHIGLATPRAVPQGGHVPDD